MPVWWLWMSILSAQAADLDVDELGTGDLLITEVMPDPSAVGDSSGEWFEIYNANPESIELLGLVLSDSSSSEIVASSVVIEPAGYVVVGVDSDETTNGGVPVDIVVSFGLTNSGEPLTLSNEAGVIDTISWSTSSAGKSRTLDPDAFGALANDDEDSWCNASSSYGEGDLGTPGADNDECAGVGPDTGDTGPITCDAAGDVVLNEFLPNPEGDDGDAEWIELTNTSSSVMDLSYWQLAAAKSSYSVQASLPRGTTLEAGGFLLVGGVLVDGADVVVEGIDLGTGSSGDLVQLIDCEGTVADTVVYGANNEDGWEDDSEDVATSLAPAAQEGVSIARVEDGVDTDLSGDDFESAEYATPGQSNTAAPEPCVEDAGLVINELLSNPAGTDDGLEWVELYHGGTETLDLTDWALQSGTTSSSWSTQVTFDGVSIAPGEYLWVGGDALDGVDVAVAGFSLPNGTGTDALRLRDCNAVTLDSVLYGEDNSEDALSEDDGTVPESGAEAPGEDDSLARIQDGYDTDVSRRDFIVESSPTPGAANAVYEPVVCVPSAGDVVLNEVLANPDGSDDGFEFIELYNNASTAVSLDGWYLSAETSGPEYDDVDIELPGGVSIEPGGFFVIGGSFVAEADYSDDFSSMGNGTDGDGLRLYDCDGNAVDTVVYGNEPDDDGVVNADGLVGDDGEVVAEPLAAPGDGEVFARRIDGVDTDAMVEDWKLTLRQTPGETNVVPEDTGQDTNVPGGCNSDDGPHSGCRSGPPEGVDPGGCATLPLPVAPAWLLVVVLAGLRRRGPR